MDVDGDVVVVCGWSVVWCLPPKSIVSTASRLHPHLIHSSCTLLSMSDVDG